MEGNITITAEEYKEMLEAASRNSEASVRISAFAGFVNQSKYSIDREDCGRFLGFGVTEEGG